jgi:hypothetical protein
MGSSAEAVLGQIILMLGTRGLRYLPALEAVIACAECSGDSRIAALTALAAIVLEMDVPETLIDAIKDAPEQVTTGPLMPVSSELIRVCKLLALVGRLSSQNEAELIALGRSNDARVRQIAVNAAGLSYRLTGHSALAHVLIAGLFDPHAVVIERALAEVQQQTPEEMRPVIEQRLAALVVSYPRAVRRRAAAVAGAMNAQSSSTRLVAVLDKARLDKSRMVRLAATQVL